jgi:hypothetical protein
MNFHEFDILLQALQLMSPRQRRSFFKLATDSQLRAFEEACYNLVKNSKFSSKKLAVLAKQYGPSIKVLAQKKYSVKTKRKLLVQKGGFLATLLPVIASIVTSLIAART